ncbi:MAG: hypothetical protein MZU97_13740 [Bacillus subtilis]|nr:hypothetical protein [Bacillus subtilis]
MNDEIRLKAERLIRILRTNGWTRRDGGILYRRACLGRDHGGSGSVRKCSVQVRRLFRRSQGEAVERAVRKRSKQPVP